jgi:hypothetical protein
MASKKTLNAKNLETLGAERLAELLIEISTGSAVAKRRLRLELAGAQSPKEAAHEIAKRLTSIARGRSTIGWKNRKPFMEDLETQLRGIVDQIGPNDPQEALMLMWRFLGLTNSVIERCNGGDDAVITVFHQACADLGALVESSQPTLGLLVDTAFDALCENRFGQFDELISVLAPTLEYDGLEQLKRRFETLAEGPDARVVNMGADQHLHGVADRRTQLVAQRALLEIADAQGDVDAFIAQCEPRMRTVPSNAIQIAQRLLAADRAEEALEILDKADTLEDDWDRPDWQDARIAVLETLGRRDEAQAFRWACFERDLSADYLRAYLAKLPDFEDIEAEERAVAIAMADPELLAPLQFFLDWQSPDRAAELLLTRHTEIDGNFYEFLTPAADALTDRHPLAATLVLRAMIDFALIKVRSKRYRHVAAHLVTCAKLAPQIENFGAFESHDSYVARLKEQHGRKHGFWEHVR